MPRKVFVIGHKNPDTDAIVSAIAYAEYLRRQGLENAVAARQGDLWRETKYILDRFEVPPPTLVEDVRPTAGDVMAADLVAGRPEESAYAIGRRLREHRIRAMPILDGERHLVGLIAVEDFAYTLLSGLDSERLDSVHLDVHNVVKTLGGRLLVEARDRHLRDKVMVAAMDVETVRRRVEPDIMMVMGDRENAQRVAIEEGVGALVITGDLPVSAEIVALAREKNVTLISSPHHTFTTVRLISLSIPIFHFMRREVMTAAPDEPLDELRDKLTQQRTIPIVNSGGQVVGVVSRSSLLNPVRHGVYLVDHNERSQTVDGLEDAELLGIVDHHRIADIQSTAPIFFRNEIIGSTSTIVAGLYEESGLSLSPSLAGILLGGLVTDTVLFRSPTSTPRDRQVARKLAATAGVDIEEFGQAIFAVASDLSGRSPRQILTTDFKEFRIEDMPFAIGYMETVHKGQVDQIRDQLLAELRALQAEKGYAALLFMIVDIVHSQTEILIAGWEKEVAAALNHPLVTPHSVLVEGVMSRKKQVVPILPQVVRAIQDGKR